MTSTVLQNRQSQFRIFLLSGAIIIAVWALSGALSARHMNWLETQHAAGILLGLIAGWLFCRGKANSNSPAGRIWTVALFVSAALMLSPVFHHALQGLPLGQFGAVNLICVFLPIILMTALVLAQTAVKPAHSTSGHEYRNSLEKFLTGPVSVRLNLAAASAVIVFANAGMSGMPVKAAILQSIILGAAILSLPALFELASIPAGALVMNGAMAMALSACVLLGTWRHLTLWRTMDQAKILLAQDKIPEAVKYYTEASELNAVLSDKRQSLETELNWAVFHERHADLKEHDMEHKGVNAGDYELALVHWRNVADMSGIDGNDFLPIRRVLCKQGDSLNAWRRLIFQGFPAIDDPEIAPGILALGDMPGQKDPRGALLSALLAWDQNSTDADRKRRLNLVQRVAPNEPTSYNLLTRMGVNMPDASLWLPPDLIVGTRLSENSPLGDISDLGEVDTLVVLNPGHWEMGVNARATPLHEEWPIMRIEFYGYEDGRSVKHEVGRTQVTHPDNRDVPFTFNVTRGDIYHIKIIFENRQEEFNEGRLARRSLSINGLSFRKAKAPAPLPANSSK